MKFRRAASYLWALLPLGFGLPAAPVFAWAAWRLRSRALAVEALLYLVLTVLWIALANQQGSLSGLGSAIAVALAVVATTRALMIRSQVFFPEHPESPAVATVSAPLSTSSWTPAFPASSAPPRDPNNPATWVTSMLCTGQDQHPLSVPVQHAAVSAVAGALLIAFDIRVHFYGRGFGLGIGLALAPVFALLFKRWVDGPVLYYRTWGRLHQLRLDTVTAVDTGKQVNGSRSVQLIAPGLTKPLRVALTSSGYVMAPAARDHLRGWLSNPQVRWSPAALALFDGHTAASTAPARRRHRVLAVTLGILLPAAIVVTGLVVAWERQAARAIAGAPGYHRFGGPHGKLLAVGRPWGSACQPIRFTAEEHVPDWVYSQVVTVVAEARRDGLDVTLEGRDFNWAPSSLYYPPGQSPSSVRRVPIFWNSGTPPTLSTGRPEHIGLGWDAQLDPDGSHEDMTYAQGILWVQSLDGQPQLVRRSVRQLVALTQGIISTSRHDSGIANNASVYDAFSASDVAAMRLMSGCGVAAVPTVSR